MGINIEQTKLRLIEMIMNIEDKTQLQTLTQVAEHLTDEASEQPDISLAIKPIRSNVSLEDIHKEQNYQPVSYQKFRADADAIGLEEPIEDLLALLSK